MAKLYPPEIGGTIPAFYDNSNENGEIKLTIPFIMNKTVSQNEIGGFKLIVKTVANSKLIGNLTTKIENIKLPPWNFTKGEVYFMIPKEHILRSYLMAGQYYKVQLAYINKQNNDIGYYSSTGVIKYTTKPDVIIQDLEFAKINMNNQTYIGTYSQSKLSNNESRDVSEKVYSYEFNIYDELGNLYDTSGIKIHNSFEDENAYSSKDIFTLNKDLQVNKNYYIQYVITTTNNAIFKSSKYHIMQKESIDPEIKADLIVDFNEENGYASVSLRGKKDENGIEYSATGSFILKRACSKDNYGIWSSILTFRLNGHQPSMWLWKDLTLEHGYSYKYAIQQFNDNGLHSKRIESNEVYSSFEDCFLSDGKRQLRISYNPKISSFKDTLMETKTNTIGSKYPFIFRNGSVRYKEFPIAGLISYLSDEEELFMTKEELFHIEDTHNLTDRNIASERIFKMAAMDFFNDGKPKIFRSPTEGNYIVRLMNTSLSPEETLGRMLHTISTTASEVADFSYSNLLNYGFVELIDTTKYMTRWETIEILSRDENGNTHVIEQGEELLNNAPATSLTFEGFIPGTSFILFDSTGHEMSIVIGPTGSYKIDFGMEFASVKLDSKGVSEGSLTYSYQSNISNVFDTIKDVDVEDYPLVQLIGKNNILEKVQDKVKTFLTKFSYLRFNKRAVYNLYTSDEKSELYWDINLASQVIEDNLEKAFIYKIYNIDSKTYYYVDGCNPNEPLKNYANYFIINGSQIDLTETEVYELINPSQINELTMESGLTLECSYQSRILNYSLEDKVQNVIKAKKEYDKAYEKYIELLRWDYEIKGRDETYYTDENGYTPLYFSNLEKAENELNGKDENGNTLYDIYIKNLAAAIEEQKEANLYNE